MDSKGSLSNKLITSGEVQYSTGQNDDDIDTFEYDLYCVEKRFGCGINIKSVIKDTEDETVYPKVHNDLYVADENRRATKEKDLKLLENNQTSNFVVLVSKTKDSHSEALDHAGFIVQNEKMSKYQ